MVNVIFSVSFRTTFPFPALKYNSKTIISSSANIFTVNGKMKFSILFDAGNHPTVYQSVTLLYQTALCSDSPGADNISSVDKPKSLASTFRYLNLMYVFQTYLSSSLMLLSKSKSFFQVASMFSGLPYSHTLGLTIIKHTGANTLAFL
jgi:hypothetical protein